jgi:hypothetical protein
MEENTSNKKTDSDEIDLIDLFRRMSRSTQRGLKSLSKGILISIVFLIRHWLPLSVAVAVGLITSIILRKYSESNYVSDMVLKVNVKPVDEMISHINKLHSYCLEEQRTHLARSISLPAQQVRNITDIQAYWIIDNGHDKIPDYVDYNNNHPGADTNNVRMEDRLNIRIRVKSEQELTRVREGILNFINSEPLFHKKNQLRIKQLNNYLSRIDYDISRLDSLQKLKYFEESKQLHAKTGGQMIFLQEQKTQLIFPEIHGLYSQKKELEAELDIYRDIVTIISDFNILIERENGLMYYAGKMVPVLFLITLLLLIALANKKKLKEVYHKY